MNLLKSYRFNTNTNIPFAIIADCENQYTKEFDKVIILEKSSKSYMDKLEMLNCAPFDENIYIDADCLVYRDINTFWDYFPNKGIGCFGKALELSSQDGWFKLEDIGEYAKCIDFIPQMHGGIIFFKKDEVTQAIYKMSLDIAKHYNEYCFKYFSMPADEPILALCMAVYKCLPIELPEIDIQKTFLFFPLALKVKVNILKHICSYTIDGEEWKNGIYLLHWQNVFTKSPKYHKEIIRLNNLECGLIKKLANYLIYLLHTFKFYAVRNVRNMGHEIKRVFVSIYKK